MPCHTRMKTTILQGVIWLCLLLFGMVSSAIEPGFLDFDNLPDTNFTCVGKVIGGYYADLETNCQMFHVCTIGQLDEPMDIRFLCLNGTVFDQETRVCERIDEVDCTKSEKFYHLNLELYGNTAPPIVEEPEPTPSTTTTTQRTTSTFRTTRPTYTTKTTTTNRPQHQTPKIIESHHFPTLGHHHQHTGADIRFNPEEINIRLNPGQPPIIKPHLNKYPTQSYGQPKLIITTHRNIFKNFPITTTTTQRPKFKKYQHNYDYSYQQTENSDLDYNTELPSGYGYSDSSYEEDLSKEYTKTRLPTIPKPQKVYRTEKPNLQIPHSLVPTLPPFTISSPSPFTIRHYDQKRSNERSHDPPRVIISASASVSDASGRRLNYSLGTIEASHILGTPPHSYDEYKESDVVLDPFYYDVPKVPSQRKHSRSKRQTNRRRGRTKFVPPDYVDDNYEPLTYEETPKSVLSTTGDTIKDVKNNPSTEKPIIYEEDISKKILSTTAESSTHYFKVTTERSKATVQPQVPKKRPTKQDIELYNKLLDELVEEIIKEAINNRNKQKINPPNTSGSPIVRVITLGNTPRPFGKENLLLNSNTSPTVTEGSDSKTSEQSPNNQLTVNPTTITIPKFPLTEKPKMIKLSNQVYISDSQSTNLPSEVSKPEDSVLGVINENIEHIVSHISESHTRPNNIHSLGDEYGLLSPLLNPISLFEGKEEQKATPEVDKISSNKNLEINQENSTPDKTIPEEGTISTKFSSNPNEDNSTGAIDVQTTQGWTYEVEFTTHKLPVVTTESPVLQVEKEVPKVSTENSLLHLVELTTKNSLQLEGSKEDGIAVEVNNTSVENSEKNNSTSSEEGAEESRKSSAEVTSEEEKIKTTSPNLEITTPENRTPHESARAIVSHNYQTLNLTPENKVPITTSSYEVSTVQTIPTVIGINRRQNQINTSTEKVNLPTLLDLLKHSSEEENFRTQLDNQNLQSTQQEVVAKIPEIYETSTSSEGTETLSEDTLEQNSSSRDKNNTKSNEFDGNLSSLFDFESLNTTHSMSSYEEIFSTFNTYSTTEEVTTQNVFDTSNLSLDTEAKTQSSKEDTTTEILSTTTMEQNFETEKDIGTLGTTEFSTITTEVEHSTETTTTKEHVGTFTPLDESISDPHITTEPQLQLFTSKIIKEEVSQEGTNVLQANQIVSNEETSNAIEENYSSTEPARSSGRRRGYERSKSKSWRRNGSNPTTGRHRFSSPTISTPPVLTRLQNNIITTELDNQKDNLVTEAGFAKSVNPTESKKSHSTTPLSKLIRNGFNCIDKILNNFYEDPRDCRLFHYCTHGFSDTQVVDMKFVCDFGTYFDIDKLICTKIKPSNCK